MPQNPKQSIKIYDELPEGYEAVGATTPAKAEPASPSVVKIYDELPEGYEAVGAPAITEAETPKPEESTVVKIYDELPEGYEAVGEKPKDESTEDKNESAEDKALRLLRTRIGGGGDFTEEEIKDLVKEFGVSEEFVRSQINWAASETEHQGRTEGGVTLDRIAEDFGPAVKVLVGTLDEATGHIVSSIVNNAIYEDNEKKAIDVIRELASKKRTTVMDVALVLGSMAAGARTAKAAKAAVLMTKSPALMKAAKHPLGMIAIGATEGAMYGAGEAETGKALEGAAWGAALGGAVSGVGAGIAARYARKSKLRAEHAPKIKGTPAQIERAANDIGLKWDEIHEATKKIYKQEVDMAVSYVNNEKYSKLVDASIKNYGKQISAAKRSKKRKHVVPTLEYGRDKMVRARDLARESNTLKNQPHLRDTIETSITTKRALKELEALPSFRGESSFWLGMGDSLTSARTLQGKYGIPLEKAIMDYSHRSNKAKNIVNWANKKVSDAMESLPKYATREQLVGKTAALTEDDRALQKMTSSIYEHLENTFGIKLPRQEGFILPRITKTRQDWIVSLDDKLREYGIDVQKKKGPGGSRWSLDTMDLEAADGTELDELLSHVMDVTGIPQPKKAIEAAYNNIPAARNVEEWFIKRLAERNVDDMKIPDWAVVTNIEEIFGRYTRDLAKGIATSSMVPTYRAAIKVAEKAGDGGAAKWLRSTLDEAMGYPTNFVDSSDITPAQMSRGFGNASTDALIRWNRGDKSAYTQAMVLLPHVGSMFARLPYANLLSKPISFMKNAASPVFSTLPYLLAQGVPPGHAVKIFTTSLIDTAKQLRQVGGGKGVLEGLKNIRHGEADVLERGLVHTHFSQDMAEKAAAEAIRGMKKDSVGGKALKALERGEEHYTNAFLYMFQVSETFARVWSKNMATSAAKELAQNPALGKEAMRKSDSLVLRQSKWAKDGVPKIGSADYAEFEKDMVDVINANTMFNYDRVNMSANMRYLGPLFSQFSKWPMMQLGKMQSAWKTQGPMEASRHLGISLGLPYLIAVGMDRLAEANDFDDDDVYRTWVGRASDYAPLSSLESVLRPDRINPPAAATLSAIVSTILNPEKNGPEALEHMWNYYGISAPEKVYGAFETTATGTYEPPPVQSAIRSLKSDKK